MKIGGPPNSVTKNIKTTQIKHKTLKARSVKSKNSQKILSSYIIRWANCSLRYSHAFMVNILNQNLETDKGSIKSYHRKDLIIYSGEESNL